MGYQDFYRLSVHAVLFDSDEKALFVKTTYGGKTWTLPGGAMDPGETIHETLVRECREELGREIKILYLSGVYFHEIHNSHAFVFRCEFADQCAIALSEEHSEYRYFSAPELPEPNRVKIQDCLNYRGNVVSNKF